MASKMAAETRKFNISDCMAEKTEILKTKHTVLWSRNAMEPKLITICRPITHFAEIFKMAAENRKLSIPDCMADKTHIPSAKHAFVW